MDFNVLLLLVGCLVAATLASVTGFGGTTLLLPFSVWVFGVEDAVPIMTITSLAGNASRVWLNWRDISLTVTKWFALGCIPAAILGGFVFANVSAGILLRPLGVF